MKLHRNKVKTTDRAWEAYHPDRETLEQFYGHIAGLIDADPAAFSDYEHSLRALEYAWKLGFYAALESVEAGMESPDPSRN